MNAAKLQDLRILVAEDEGMLAWQIASILESAGCEVVGPFARVEDVLRAAAEHQLDGAVLDVNLRGQPVFPAAQMLHARGVPVVLSSGYTDSSTFPEAFREAPCVRKPYDAASLIELCRRHFKPPTAQPETP